MTLHHPESFWAAPLERRIALVRDEAQQDRLTELLGADGYRQYRALAERIDGSAHLASAEAPSVVFLPGIMGSVLGSRRLGGVWWIDVRARDKIDKLRLAPNGLEDADNTSEVVPLTTDVAYDGLLAGLIGSPFRHEIAPFDWRKPLGASTAVLREQILRMRENRGGPVHVVAHSMGGLVLRAALKQYGEELWPAIDRIVFIATPHYGATAIAGYLKNHLWGFEALALVGLFLSRETLRSFWGRFGCSPRRPASIRIRAGPQRISGADSRATTRTPARTSICTTRTHGS